MSSLPSRLVLVRSEVRSHLGSISRLVQRTILSSSMADQRAGISRIRAVPLQVTSGRVSMPQARLSVGHAEPYSPSRRYWREPCRSTEHRRVLQPSSTRVIVSIPTSVRQVRSNSPMISLSLASRRVQVSSSSEAIQMVRSHRSYSIRVCSGDEYSRVQGSTSVVVASSRVCVGRV